MFPKENDPSGGRLLFSPFSDFADSVNSDPETWTREELRRWLATVSQGLSSEDSTDSIPQRNLHPNSKDTKEELLERVKANMRVPRT